MRGFPRRSSATTMTSRVVSSRLLSQVGFDVVAETDNPAYALSVIEQFSVDEAVVDISLDKGDGEDVIRVVDERQLGVSGRRVQLVHRRSHDAHRDGRRCGGGQTRLRPARGGAERALHRRRRTGAATNRTSSPADPQRLPLARAAPPTFTGSQPARSPGGSALLAPAMPSSRSTATSSSTSATLPTT